MSTPSSSLPLPFEIRGFKGVTAAGSLSSWLVCIQGDNAAGKDAIMDGFTVGWTGQGFDIAGRDVMRDPRSLMQLLHPGGIVADAALYAVIGDAGYHMAAVDENAERDDVDAKFVIKKAKLPKGVRRIGATAKSAGGRLTLTEIEDAFRGTVAKAQQWLMRNATPVTWEQLAADPEVNALSPTLQQETQQRFGEMTLPNDGLPALVKACTGDAKTAAALHERLKIRCIEVAAEAGAALTFEEEALVVNARAVRAATPFHAPTRSGQQIAVDWQAAYTRGAQAAQQVQALQSQLVTLPAGMAANDVETWALIRVAWQRAQAANSGAQQVPCTCCGTPKAHQDVAAWLLQAERVALMGQQRTDLEAEVAKWLAAQTAVQEDLARLQQELAGVQAAPTETPEVAALVVRADAHALLPGLIAERDNAQRRSADLSALAQMAQVVTGHAVKSALGAFLARVNARIPFTVGINLDPTAAGIVFIQRDNGQQDYALSGWEYVAIYGALALTIARPGDVVVIPDRTMQLPNRLKFMATMAQAPSEGVLVLMPSTDPVSCEGWQTLHVQNKQLVSSGVVPVATLLILSPQFFQGVSPTLASQRPEKSSQNLPTPY